MQHIMKHTQHNEHTKHNKTCKRQTVYSDTIHITNTVHRECLLFSKRMRINPQTEYDRLGEEINKNKVGVSIDSARIIIKRKSIESAQ